MSTVQFTAKFEEVKALNPLFSQCKIYTLYTGMNRNNSFISKEAVEKSLHTLYNIPIVGEFIEYADNFGGHGGKIEITDKGIDYVITTKPYGLVPESAEIYWESVTEENGTVNEYLVIDKAILWTGRYSDLKDLLSQPYGQSMEIDVNDGSFVKMNNNNVYEIRDFTFSALCILGVDKDGEGRVEPCFESASISAYSLDKDKFKLEFTQMMAELKFAMSQDKSLQHNEIVVAEELQEGGNKKVPEEILALLEKYSLTESDLVEKEIDYAEYSVEELEAKINETFQKEEDKVEDVEVTQEFSLTSNQLEDELRRELKEIEVLTEVYWDEVYTYPRYYYRDCKPDQNLVIAMDEKNWYLVGFTYSVNGDAVEVDKSSIKRFKLDYLPMDLSGDPEQDEVSEIFVQGMVSESKTEFMIQAKEKELNKKFEEEKAQFQIETQVELDKVKTEFAELKLKYSTLEDQAKQFESELFAKAQQERLDAETEIFESFSAELTEEEMKPVREKASEMSLEDITDKLFSIAGRKKVSFKTKETKDKPLSFQIPVEEKKVSGKAYDDLFDRYLANKK